MNPGLVDETGKVAASAIEALRSQPVVLASVLLNVVIMTGIFFGVRDQRQHYTEITKILLDQNAKAQEMLAQCVVPK